MRVEFHTSPYDVPFHPNPVTFLPGFELEVHVSKQLFVGLSIGRLTCLWLHFPFAPEGAVRQLQLSVVHPAAGPVRVHCQCVRESNGGAGESAAHATAGKLLPVPLPGPTARNRVGFLYQVPLGHRSDRVRVTGRMRDAATHLGRAMVSDFASLW